MMRLAFDQGSLLLPVDSRLRGNDVWGERERRLGDGPGPPADWMQPFSSGLDVAG